MVAESVFAMEMPTTYVISDLLSIHKQVNGFRVIKQCVKQKKNSRYTGGKCTTKGVSHLLYPKAIPITTRYREYKSEASQHSRPPAYAISIPGSCSPRLIAKNSELAFKIRQLKRGRARIKKIELKPVFFCEEPLLSPCFGVLVAGYQAGASWR
jgi:hypothetical protein